MKNFIYRRFPEALFPPENPQNYYRRVVEGLKVAQESRVIITGICRNINPVLEQTMARLEKTVSLFWDCRVVLYENDSTDGTSEKLQEYATTKDWLVLLQENTGHKPFDRTREVERAKYLGSLRNNCMDHIEKFYRGWLYGGIVDYIIVLDPDLDGGWSYDGILHSLSYDGHSTWDCMSANGIAFRNINVTKHGKEVYDDYQRLFFDTWAYRDFGDEKLQPSEVLNLYQFDRGEEPVKVFSNFNGLAIYKDNFLKYRYDAHENEDGTVTNEHSFIHKKMREDGCKIYLNPNLITLYSPTEYSIKF